MKTVSKSLLLYVLFSSAIFSYDDIRDEKGRTSLMRLVIDFQLNFQTIKEDIARLWDVCYEYADVTDGYITVEIDAKTSHSKPIYKRKVKRKQSCLDSDILAHRQREQDFYKLIENTVKEIRRLVDQEHVAVAALDHDGYTALNYCYTPEIYAELRRCGVPFQWKVWAYFNPWYATCTCTGLGIAGLSGYLYLHKP